MLARILPRKFYERPSIVVAPDLIGKVLVRDVAGSRLEGIIVETEAYAGLEDPASHAYRGKTKRNEVMFGEAGHAYVYFTYGFHHCLNFVTATEGTPEAVLIRALEPITGIEEMKQRRMTSDLRNLTSGPGKLCKALAIDRSLNGIDVTKLSSQISVREGKGTPRLIGSSARIGIRVATQRPWRFFDAQSEFVSAKKQTRMEPTSPAILPK